MSKEAMKLALDNLIAEYHMESSSFAKRVDDIFKEALAQPQQEPDLSGLKPSTQEVIKGWIEDGTFIERAIGAMQEQEAENMRLEKMAAPQPAQRKPLTDWVNVDERLPEKGGYYLVTVDTDDGPHVDVLLFNEKRKHWEHEGEPTFCHSYFFNPTHWANRPEAAHNIKENT